MHEKIGLTLPLESTFLPGMTGERSLTSTSFEKSAAKVQPLTDISENGIHHQEAGSIQTTLGEDDVSFSSTDSTDSLHLSWSW